MGGDGGGAARSYAALCRWGKVWVLCCAFCRCFATFVAAFLRRFWLRQQPCGSLRRPGRSRGIAISRLRTVRIRAQCSVRLRGSRTPVALRATCAGPPWILLYPLKRRRSAMGMGAAERCVLARRSAIGARVRRGELRSSSAALSCASKLFGPFFSQNQFERAIRPSRIDFGELVKRTAQTARVRLPVCLSARPAARPL